MKTMNGILAATAAIVATTVIAGCTGDESAPRAHARKMSCATEKAQDNAFNRETEAPERDLPTSGREFPGQSRHPASLWRTSPRSSPPTPAASIHSLTDISAPPNRAMTSTITTASCPPCPKSPAPRPCPAPLPSPVPAG